MHLRFRDSLLMSLGIVMTTIALLAFASMAASIFIADTTQGLATAINESGALRMRSYRIASSLTNNTDGTKHWKETYQLVTEFEEHLYSSNLTDVVPENASTNLKNSYEVIKNRWKSEIKPLFDIYLDGIVELLPATRHGTDMSISPDAVDNLRSRYFLVVPDFVNDIDHLVSLLEEHAETKIKGLRNLQYIALVITTLLTVIALIIIYRRIHKPLKQLLTGAERASKSDFSFHINYTGKDELGRLGSAFNTMSEDLSKIYSELEDRIKQKTNDLEQSNHSLELLYNTANHLNENKSESLHTTYTKILNDIKPVAKISGGAICLNDNKNKQASMLASTLSDKDISFNLCKKTNCEKCLDNNDSRGSVITYENKQIISLPISDQTQQYGVLIIQSANNKSIEPWQQQLLESIARHIGIAIKLSKQSVESRRLILVEERGAIARELHDSLAQSLTYMKIQLSRLHAITKKSEAESEETKIIDDLRLGLNSAYRELRELLTTFRLKIDGKDFNDAMIKTVSEFNERSDTKITFDNQIAYFYLTPNEEIHVLQLIREALSNIAQHSQATEASVQIQYINSGKIQIEINDNGTGINESKSKTHHYGLSIMKERTKTLNGNLNITNNPDGGVQVSLQFTPTNKTASIHLNQINK